MFEAVTRRIAVAAMAAVLIAVLGGASSAQAKEKNSGFLGDYSQLRTQKDPLGMERRVWVSPKFKRDAYRSALVDPVGFYPEPHPSEKVSMGALNDIRQYTQEAVNRVLGDILPLASAPGPGVLHVRIAVTGVEVEGMKLKPYQLIPIGLVITTAKEAAGAGRRNVKLMMEAEVTDSVSGEPLMRSVRETRGVEVRSDEPLTLEVARPQIDKWAEAAHELLAAQFRKQP